MTWCSRVAVLSWSWQCFIGILLASNAQCPRSHCQFHSAQLTVVLVCSSTILPAGLHLDLLQLSSPCALQTKEFKICASGSHFFEHHLCGLGLARRKRFEVSHGATSRDIKLLGAWRWKRADSHWNSGAVSSPQSSNRINYVYNGYYSIVLVVFSFEMFLCPHVMMC